MTALSAADDAGSVPRRDSGDMDLERFRVELGGYCYRMLGSAFEMEDAVQETLVRAWRSLDRFDEARGPLRSWLYTIATNICLDMLRSAQRRARAMDLGPSAQAGPDLGVPLPQSMWLEPIPDGRILPAGGDPAELTARRETIRLAFVAALQHLPPRQRAVLILRDVLSWKADEVARLLGCTVASVTSALQRARATLKTIEIAPAEPVQPVDQAQRRLLARYCEAFERYDVETLVSLLHEDATMSMPPFSWWLRGRAEIRRALLAAGRPCEGARLVPTVANGSPAFGQYRPSGPDGHFQPFALMVVELSGGLITETTTYLDAERMFPLFDLPATPVAAVP
ncbi:sigma-70 family RNA polymerase sigma factor [Microtetraspora sp. AC03309]|uniref:sigma-70 family RNA polymerase sigma factor n=1 Tax=Microtetraspora sp. AC03309 TaxID=2779376 RepID=UPI001E45C060|nr:sigma-70 family RNA polymerase sigma factor [Microtetraspora sp. AC03309]MCC5580116.1 sigma-70 family RNA polymerase sigma factor [Microtetraspora sp. AC03309]